MSNVFYRHCHVKLPVISRGDGVYLFDENNNKYLDACGGAAVSNLGHSHAAVKQAIIQQVSCIPYAHTGFFTSSAGEALAQKLCELAPDSLNHAYFVSGGSEAVETALKLARQYFYETGQPAKNQFIARRQSYHGNTLGALSVGGNEWRREPFRPLLSTGHHIAPYYPYRDKADEESIEQYSVRVADELEDKIVQIGAENVMAFVAEPVVGATAGALAANKLYFSRIRQICDKYNVLLILDEVMCGVGRTGTFYAFEQDQVIPDIVTMAKGLGAGYQPIGAVLASDCIYQSISSGSGFFQHGHTFTGHPTACAAALATVNTIIDENLLGRVTRMGEYLKDKLQQRLSSLTNIGDIRGRGLFIGIELVADKQSKQPIPLSSNADKQVKSLAMQHGLLCYPMAGTIDGKQGHHILLAPPFIITESEIDELVEKLHQTISDSAASWS
ncbi:aspartate aminotransferase family protein [Vibrio sp. SCSIO 43137]|uniref:aspartate aminotransferase family protein n=1 Tax=Vibrio sp. SCSIO 43137 TaxID=3021011 RepID=UPI002308075B|nr:aspartate aminotransferase family protein [Vibrio sp. SCSIO 43137]WCE30884.1 aspartate aminotransferase family protein [Vibrio sp. SCSIO 43137]